jgi:hypothetical protein
VARSLWRRWTAVVAAGEFVGFVAPATVGAVTATAGADPVVTYLSMAAAGAVEGACLGAAQAWALRRHLPHLAAAPFILGTAAAAVFAYLVAMLPSTLGDRWAAVPVPLMMVAVAIGSVAGLASIGTAQWLVLRRTAPGTGWWVVTTAGAWLAGLAAFLLVATPLWQPGQPIALIIAIGVLAGAVMAVTVAALTGLAAVRLVRRAVSGPGAAGEVDDGELRVVDRPGVVVDQRPNSVLITSRSTDR